MNEPPKNFMLQKNDTQYRILNNTYWFGVQENTAITIATIKYTDEDGGQDHTFSVTPAFDARYFTVKAAGQGAFVISTTGLNAEVHNGSCFDFIVKDNGKPPMSGAITICFRVQGRLTTLPFPLFGLQPYLCFRHTRACYWPTNGL